MSFHDPHFTRTVLDSAVLLDTMSGYDPNDPSSLGVTRSKGTRNGREESASLVLPQLLGKESMEWEPQQALEKLLLLQVIMIDDSDPFIKRMEVLRIE